MSYFNFFKKLPPISAVKEVPYSQSVVILEPNSLLTNEVLEKFF